MSRGLAIDVELSLGRFDLSVSWHTDERAVAVFGPSGAGKTTLLEILAGLRRGAGGRIRIGEATWLDSANGIDLPAHRRGVGYVPQDMLLFPHRDVTGNLLAGRRRAERRSAGRVSVDRVLDLLELGPLRSARVETLSGGEKRRVALGRALCSGPDLLLLDEPLVGLDAGLRRKVLPYLIRVRDELDIPFVLVTHDASEVRMLSREVAVLDRGRLVARGAPAEALTDPAALPLARTDGYQNVLRGVVRDVGESVAAVELAPDVLLHVPADGLEPGEQVMVGLRAEDLMLSLDEPQGLSARNVLAGVVREIRSETEGSAGSVLLVVSLSGVAEALVVALTPGACDRLALAPGQRVFLVSKAHSCRVLVSLDKWKSSSGA